MEKSQNWKSDFSESFKSISSLYEFLGWEQTDLLSEVAKTYPIFVPRRIAQKIKLEGPLGPLALEFIPDESELGPGGLIDPIGDEAYNKAPQLIHRYETRALFTPTTVCPIHCRYCFRKNELNTPNEIFQQDFEKTISYLQEHPEVTEIIFTGGDPLTLSNEKISKFLDEFSKVKSIKDIRFHTRYPVILPSRIDDEFSNIIRKFKNHFRTITVVIHANHKNEFDTEATSAIKALKSSGAQLLSQSVFLKDVNNNLETMIDLMNVFVEHEIRPYYIHHPDKVKGGLHFTISLEEGRAIYLAMRDKLPGWALPHYIIDIPNGEGKISAFNPESLSYSGNFLSKNGKSIPYDEV